MNNNLTFSELLNISITKRSTNSNSVIFLLFCWDSLNDCIIAIRLWPEISVTQNPNYSSQESHWHQSEKIEKTIWLIFVSGWHQFILCLVFSQYHCHDPVTLHLVWHDTSLMTCPWPHNTPATPIVLYLDAATSLVVGLSPSKEHHVVRVRELWEILVNLES